MLRRLTLFLILCGLAACATSESVVERTEPPVRAWPLDPPAADLLARLYDLSGTRTLSGQHNFVAQGSRSTAWIEGATGKTPAVWGSDFGYGKPGNRRDDLRYRRLLVDEATRQWEAGAAVTIMWHACPPTGPEPCDWADVQSDLDDAAWADLLTPGTAVHRRWQAQVDSVAMHLKRLRAAGVPILWRPYHEMNGGWFWWGRRHGPNGFRRLWAMLYDRLVGHHGLANLIWVWNPNAPRYADAYRRYLPDLDRVDVLATDVYGGVYLQKYHDDLLALADGRPIALGEVGALPPFGVFDEQPRWVWLMAWADVFDRNTVLQVRRFYDTPRLLHRPEGG